MMALPARHRNTFPDFARGTAMFKQLVIAFSGLTALVFSTDANAACPTFHALTNGSAADAGQVMDNYNYILQCPNFTGTVGIGTASPAAKLDVQGPSGWPATSGTVSAALVRARATDTNVVLDGGAMTPSPWSYWLQVTDSTNLALVYALALNPNGGRVGVGVIAPAATFDTAGAGAAPATSGTTTTAITRVRAKNTGAVLDSGALATSPWSYWMQVTDFGNLAANYPLALNPNGGKVGIGTSSPAQALEVHGQVQVDTLASASSTSLCITSTSNGVIATCSSSIRYKENVKDANFGLKEVMAMRPVTFKWKGRTEQDFGLIAEEVAKIDPRYVTYKDGRIEGVKYPQLTAVLVNAVKELNAANHAQAAEIARLNQQNVDMVGQLRRQAADVQNVRDRLDAVERKLTVRTASTAH
jgi:hypothetical protein